MSYNKRPVKVLQIGMTRNLGGLESYLMQQFRHLDKSRVTYDFVNITSEYEIVFKDEILKSGSKIFGIVSRHVSPIRHYMQWLNLLYQVHDEYKAIVLNSNSLAYVFPLFAAMFFRIPIRIMHSHNSGFETEMSLLRRILIIFNKILLSISATHLFACSEKAGRWMFGQKNFTVINNAIDCEKFRYSPERRKEIRQKMSFDDKFVLGHVGRFTYQKNHIFLIDIFAALAQKIDNATLLLIGDAVEDTSFLDEAKRKVKDYKLEERVIFAGLRTDIADLMQAMDCFLLPSHFEGLPVVGIEAQAAGLPCCFSDTVTREVQLTKDLVQFVSLDSVDYWIKAIEAARQIERRDTLDEMKAAGYDIKNEIEKLQRFYLSKRQVFK